MFIINLYDLDLPSQHLRLLSFHVSFRLSVCESRSRQLFKCVPMFEPVRVEAAKLFHHRHNKVTGTLYVCGNKAEGNKNATEGLKRVNRTYSKAVIILMTEMIRGPGEIS